MIEEIKTLLITSPSIGLVLKFAPTIPIILKKAIKWFSRKNQREQESIIKEIKELERISQSPNALNAANEKDRHGAFYMWGGALFVIASNFIPGEIQLWAKLLGAAEFMILIACGVFLFMRISRRCDECYKPEKYKKILEIQLYIVRLKKLKEDLKRN